MKPEHSSVAHFFAAGKYTSQGIRAAFKTEQSFRQEVYACLVLIPAAFFVGGSPVEVMFLIFLCLMTLTVELLNTALEYVINRIGEDLEDFHPLSGSAKDMGSAAVFFQLVMTASAFVYFFWRNHV